MLQRRYSGEFIGRDGTAWRVDIMQEADAPFASVGELTFPADEPLVIERDETKPHEPLCPSRLTLKVESPGDRTYFGLYTVNPVAVRADVYRAGSLYWSGLLDAEQYEEPYERAALYDVTLTFSDFGVLSRTDFAGSGRLTLSQYVALALQDCRLSHLPIDESLVSSAFPDGDARSVLDGIAVVADNFYDEQGEPLTQEEVLSGVLQPLALRITQRAGRIIIYDINGLAGAAQAADVDWSADTQTLSVGEVYKKVVIDFAPYQRATLFDGTIDSEAKLIAPVQTIDIRDDSYGSVLEYWERVGLSETVSDSPYELLPCGSDTPSHTPAGQTRVRYAQATTQWNEQSGTFLLHYLRTPDQNVYCYNGTNVQPNAAAGWPFRGNVGESFRNGAIAKENEPILRTKPFYLAASDGSTTRNFGEGTGGSRFGTSTDGSEATTSRGRDWYGTARVPEEGQIKLSLEALLDPRTEPMNGGGINDNIVSTMAYIAIPARLLLRDADGNVTHHYCNNYHLRRNSASFQAAWLDGEGEWDEFFLMFYEYDGSYKGDWQKNRRFFNQDALQLKDYNLADRLSHYGDGAGEYIALPPVGGHLELQLGSCFYTFRKSDKLKFPNIRWLAFRNVKLETVDYYGDKIDETDVAFSAILNSDATEELDVDTICGSEVGRMPSALGLLTDADSGAPVTQLMREGVTDCPECLLLNTIYSAYAVPAVKLSGEAQAVPAALLCRERMQPGKLFLIAGEVYDAQDGTAELTLREVRADEYVEATIETE